MPKLVPRRTHKLPAADEFSDMPGLRPLSRTVQAEGLASDSDEELGDVLAHQLAVSERQPLLASQLFQVDTFGAEYHSSAEDSDGSLDSDSEMPELPWIGGQVQGGVGSSRRDHGAKAGKEGCGCGSKAQPSRPRKRPAIVDPLRARVTSLRQDIQTGGPDEAPEFCGSLVYDKIITTVGEALLPSPDDIFLRGGAGRFQTDIMGRDGDAVEESLFQAEKFFAEQFGLDFGSTEFGDPETQDAGVKTLEDGSASLFGYMLNPKIDFRIYTTSACGPGTIQPRGCQKIICGGWAVRLGKPTVLAGRFGNRAQTEYPEGTFVFYGDYLIQTVGEKITKSFVSDPCDPCGPKREKITTNVVRAADNMFLEFRSRTPMVPTPDFIFPIDIVVDHEKLGGGVGSGQLRASHDDRTRKWRVELTESWKFPGAIVVE
jgi:hypothetical protein